MTGTSIAHYRIAGKLGEGGMGVVYRATDTKLGRDVAVKVLPAAVAGDPARLSAFEREARTLASLNHPNIATVHGVEQGALIMELVEGPTLADRIRAGAMPVEDVQPIAMQIADALEAAHEKGIVHRDLKPANIKITPDGQVKLLDFGIAKAMDTTAPPDNPEDSPTFTVASSIPGMILGTAAYMSPEQARGGKVDRRTDIWAYGVVLYEMLTGRRLFQGETVSDTLAAVLKTDPDLDAVPVPMRPLLRRCLERDPKQRLGWIGEAKVALQHPAAQAETLPPVRAKRWPIAVLAAALAVSVVIIAALLVRQPAERSLPVRRFTLTLPRLAPVLIVPSAVISPDGGKIAYVADGKLWVRELSRADARPLEGTQDAFGVFWSPDSQSLGFAARDQLWRVNVSNEAPIALCEAVLYGGGSWSPDGQTIVFSTFGEGLKTIPAAGGTPRDIGRSRSLAGSNLGTPSFLPGEAASGWLLGVLGPSGIGRTMVAFNWQAGERRELGPGSFPVYSATGHIVYRRDGTGSPGGLWALPFSARDVKATGEAFPLVAGGNTPSVSADGTLLYADTASDLIQMVFRDRGGKLLEKVNTPQTAMAHLAISPDARSAAVSAFGQGENNIYIHDLTRSTKTRLTLSSLFESQPRWSGDGKRIVYAGFDRGGLDIYIQEVGGTGEPVLAAGKHPRGVPASWSVDGNYIAYTSVTEQGTDIWYLRRNPVTAKFEPVPLLVTRFQESSARFSPDGRFYAYVSNEGGGFEIYVRPFPDGPGKWQISTKGGTQPRWSHDGKEIFYLQGDVLMAVPVSMQGQVPVGEPRRLFATGVYGTDRANLKYDVTPDGRFLVLEPAETSEANTGTLHLVENWLAAFRPEGAGQK